MEVLEPGRPRRLDSAERRPRERGAESKVPASGLSLPGASAGAPGGARGWGGPCGDPRPGAELTGEPPAFWPRPAPPTPGQQLQERGGEGHAGDPRGGERRPGPGLLQRITWERPGRGGDPKLPELEQERAAGCGRLAGGRRRKLEACWQPGRSRGGGPGADSGRTSGPGADSGRTRAAGAQRHREGRAHGWTRGERSDQGGVRSEAAEVSPWMGVCMCGGRLEPVPGAAGALRTPRGAPAVGGPAAAPCARRRRGLTREGPG